MSAKPRSIVPLLCAWVVAGGTVAAVAAPTELRLTRFNRIYEDVAGEMPPLRLDPLVVRLASPHQAVLLKQNRIELTPLGGNRFASRVELDLLGKGELVADVDFGGNVQRFTDELVLPPQTVAVTGVVRIARGDGGYRVVAEQLPREVPITIRSRLVGQVLELCAGASLLTLGALDCEPVAAAIERPKVPLPEPGTEMFLADGDLTDGERAALDALLAGR